ncbi:helix-turn-helix domain-containing protein [Streptomyces sp. TR1341]|uniref:helix-turn-helix domain-containing protein n=1 Tax=Streptomyces TaxID=1883 RepID=UPI000A1E9EE0|nr:MULTISPECIES: helix-turn-helix domain-containing protein [Streptomyces]NDK23297.1 helix-turn-helix domain-containing protein [Streptomyces sp. TR1341]WDO04724.1 helix-turn-helix domain-containing protein [Streptomyces murinus]
MSARSGPPLSFAEAFDLPLSVDLRTAARAFGVCPGTAYKLIRFGTFPCTVLRVGRRYRIPTACLLRSLGIEERPVYAVDLELGAEHAARIDDLHAREGEYRG